MKLINALALILIIIGGINWGLIGFFQFNMISFLLGDLPLLTRVINCLVGIASLYSISFLLEKELFNLY